MVFKIEARRRFDTLIQSLLQYMVNHASLQSVTFIAYVLS